MNLAEYNYAEQFMMASEARLFGDDLALSAILAIDDRPVRHFDHDLWQQECEPIVLHDKLAKFSQNKKMHLTLVHTSQRRLAEANPHFKLWGIGLSACDPGSTKRPDRQVRPFDHDP